RRFGWWLGERPRAGNWGRRTGNLGSGKTTLTQGLADGLGVRGPITSPTFVIAREHPSLSAGPPLVHVDAYRLAGRAELDDLDLDTALDEAVTVVEWGGGLVEQLSGDRLEVRLQRPAEPEEDTRRVSIRGVGPRWEGVLVPVPGGDVGPGPGRLQ
ncbi:MAG: tRNA (adenosine(37)-N6)-threonylcarbamoyltransferase complex ATPase subunit type 1 TsaE, partial [Ornithinimicrobium sp.]|uniref:tRNA (adenosine(37)-N6)-threonylcarbamoyltransferase complex ATPase subunit type 1 TsaE n=1 Tax=Ornithinimicrobium sp. TaxID=1977084 RepID=UPI003D9AB9E5